MSSSKRQKSRWKCFFWVGLSFYVVHTIVVFGIWNSEKPDASELSLRPSRALPLDPNYDFCYRKNASYVNGSIVDESVFRRWKYIDDTIDRKFPNARVSGGIFLYPLQASILTHLIQRIHNGIRDNRKVITVCETGFGSGHSMVLFQEASTSIGPIRVVSFDKFDRPYQLPIWRHFNETISAELKDGSDPYRKKSFDFIKGGSCKTVPNHLPSFQCDILHGSSLCPTDNIDLVENSPCGVLLTSTAMNSVNDRQVYFGPGAQWRKLHERNCISNILCFREDDKLDLKRDFVFAKQGSAQSGEFCVAVTTGRCQRHREDSETMSEKCIGDVKHLLRQLDLKNICPKSQIKLPI